MIGTDEQTLSGALHRVVAALDREAADKRQAKRGDARYREGFADGLERAGTKLHRVLVEMGFSPEV